MLAVVEYDFVKQRMLSKPVEFEVDKPDEAREYAKKVAAMWCENGEPAIYGAYFNNKVEMCKGNSDFGAIIIKPEGNSDDG